MASKEVLGPKYLNYGSLITWPPVSVLPNTDDYALASGDDNNAESTGPFVDSACSVHMWNDRDCFLDFTPVHGKFIRLGNDYKLPVAGKGTVLLQNVMSEINPSISLSDTLYVPKLSKCLISVSALDDKNMKVIFDEDECKAF